MLPTDTLKEVIKKYKLISTSALRSVSTKAEKTK